MVEKKRDRSDDGLVEAADRRVRKALEARQLLEDHRVRRAQGRAKGELRDLGALALTAALTDSVFRATLLAAAAGKVMSEQKIVDIVLSSTLLAHLEAMPAATAEPLAAAPTPALPVIPIAASGVGVIHYTSLLLRAMSDKELHTSLLTLLGAIYIEDIKMWACSHPAFLETMKSIGRDVDRRIDDLQPDMAVRYLTTVRLEQFYSALERLEVLVEWEEIACSDHSMPETPEPRYTFVHSPQGDTQPAPRVFDCLKFISEVEGDEDSRQEVEFWNGTWSCDGRTVPVTEVRQAMVFAVWRERVAEARARLDKGESARDELKRLRHEQGEARRLEEEKHTVANAMKRRNAKYGPNN